MSSLNLPVKCYNSFKNKVFSDCYLSASEGLSMTFPVAFQFSQLRTSKQTVSVPDKSGNDKTKIINNLDMVSKLKLKKYTVEPLGKDTSLIRTHLYDGQSRQNFLMLKTLCNTDSLLYGQRALNLDIRE